MKLIRITRLVRRQTNSIVHCEIELCASAASDHLFLVNLRQGRAGEEWRESTRTPAPVDLNTAETLYELAVLERQAQGFVDPDAAPAPVLAAPAIAPSNVPHSPASRSPADATVLGRLEKGQWKTLNQHLRNRTIWRIGERRLREAVPQLVEMIQQGNPMQDYCLAWAIGRCGDAGAAMAMWELHRRGTTDPVRRMAHQAWLLLAAPTALQLHAETLIAGWPALLQTAWTERNEERILTLAAQEDTWGALSRSDWLEQLDQVALCNTMARGVLLAVLSRIALRAGTFRAIRHIYKAAELRADAELFGLLHQRFETTKQTTSQTRVYVRSSFVPFAKLGAQPDSSVAYGLRTRLYLLRRGWRTLRRLGEAADPSYITMALGVLAAMDDNDAGKPTTRADRHFDRYSHWMLFNRMLRVNGPWRHSASGRSWYQTGSIAPASGRQEAFAHLWDTRPDALHALLRHNRCEGVHEFAARALIDNTAYCATLPLDSVRELLRSHYTATAHFAFQVARQRIDPAEASGDWLMILLQSRLPEARQFAVDCIHRDPLRHAADALLVATMLCSPDEALRRHGLLLCQCVHSLPGQAFAVAMQILDWLDNCGDVEQAETTVPDIAADLMRVIEQALRPGAAEVPYTRLLALTAHRLAAVRALACQWLLIHALPPSSIPGATLAALLQDADVAVRSAAVRLFSALPDQVLAAQADLIALFCTSPDASMRRAIDALVQRLPASHPDLRQQLLTAMIDGLFRSETGEGLHADLIAWITGPFKDADTLRDRALLLRLLSARSKGAQELGAALLPAFTPDQFDIATWSSFGRNQNASVRQWAFAAFRAHPERARAHLEDALRLFDSRFDDSLEFAAGFFGACCSHDDWTPLLLVNLCDHLTPAVQRFGRQMIATHFDIAHVTDFMVKLSQHPSANMQLFVSNWLESACAGDLVKLQRLESYFVTVLSQVNRGRVVKSRVQSFLREQAMQSEDIAAFVARVFTRQVLTVAIADKAAYIEGLREIRARFPALEGVMTIHPPRAAGRVEGTA